MFIWGKERVIFMLRATVRTWNLSVVSSQREHGFIRASVQTVNEAVVCTRLQHTSHITLGQSSHSTSRTLRFSPGSDTERNGPNRHAPPVHWSARSDGCRSDFGSRTEPLTCDTQRSDWSGSFVLRSDWSSHTPVTSWPTCHMIHWREFEPQTGETSASEPVMDDQRISSE